MHKGLDLISSTTGVSQTFMDEDRQSRVNVYCDESCHLENDRMPIMVFGGVWCLNSEAPRLSKELALIKEQYDARGELKWNKISGHKLSFYKAVLDWFKTSKEMHFRGLVVMDKSKLRHDEFNAGSHDTFYYKMYFSLLRPILSPDHQYEIYLDIKDTQSRKKVRKLREVLCNDRYDFTSSMIAWCQNIRSHESHLLQVADFLIGAVSYKHRYELRSPPNPPSSAKLEVLHYLEQTQQVDLSRSSPLRAEKFNLFCFTPQASTSSPREGTTRNAAL
jgi:hypothetical protein